jgi:hypothetical protein
MLRDHDGAISPPSCQSRKNSIIRRPKDGSQITMVKTMLQVGPHQRGQANGADVFEIACDIPDR